MVVFCNFLVVWWCLCGCVFVILWWCSCVFVAVFLWWCGGVIKFSVVFL